MKKVWEVDDFGPGMAIICRVTFSNGLRGGACRTINHSTWNNCSAEGRRGLLMFLIRSMELDLAELAKENNTE